MKQTADLRVAVVYGSSGGCTEDLAGQLAAALRERFGMNVELSDIRKTEVESLPDYDLLFLGCSTWNWGDLQDDWEVSFERFEALKFENTRVAFFGCGDSYLYPDTFGDALGILAQAAIASGAEVIGFTPTEGYEFTESRALIDGQFVGLIANEDNEPELTEPRLNAWLDILAKDLGEA